MKMIFTITCLLLASLKADACESYLGSWHWYENSEYGVRRLDIRSKSCNKAVAIHLQHTESGETNDEIDFDLPLSLDWSQARENNSPLLVRMYTNDVGLVLEKQYLDSDGIVVGHIVYKFHLTSDQELSMTYSMKFSGMDDWWVEESNYYRE